ncbi:hypothetical protein ACE1TH_13865 [Shouchella sp. JSM 1781072]|uniref:hypothetical protein n=1 Tax=Bacillaceae TaxID=186817 RepID=UPI000C07A62C|nr:MULTISPECIES: hypothetical protein [Bacillaceae]UTR05715.1 hypothetical protein MM326_16725 [Alkalihalobacillus sp. LMS6]
MSNPYYHRGYMYHMPMRTLPAIDTTTLSQSVHQFEYLLKQSQLLMSRLEDKQFSYQLMDAAQKSNQPLVDQLIKSIPGLTVVTNIQYSPTGVVFQMQSPGMNEGESCCSLSVVLKWG